MSEQWRKQDDKLRQQHSDRVYALSKSRNSYGAQRYGDTFQGDPLDQAEEELIDGLFYIEWARKKIAELERRITELEERLRVQNA
jgi:hypothetical protein